MTAATLTKKPKPLTGGSTFFVHTALRECQPADQKARSAQNEIRLFEPATFGTA